MIIALETDIVSRHEDSKVDYWEEKIRALVKFHILSADPEPDPHVMAKEWKDDYPKLTEIEAL